MLGKINERCSLMVKQLRQLTYSLFLVGLATAGFGLTRELGLIGCKTLPFPMGVIV